MIYKIETANKKSDIHFETGLFKKAGALIRSYISGSTAAVVTDSNVRQLYANDLAEQLSQNGFNTFVCEIEAGEQSKNLDTVSKLYYEFYQAGLTRKDVVIALGGGVVGDITGFAASTYLRGVPFIQIPTTLLAQIDSSIGGKTGVDMPFGKNLVGAFYQPECIITDIELLNSLPEKEFLNGIAEAIKYGLIADKNIFEYFEKKHNENPEHIIRKCILIKADIVTADEKDYGLRMVLNFGHTFGHAIEKCQNYTGFSHGEAVSVGMVIAAKVGEFFGVTTPDTALRIESTLKACRLPVKAEVDTDELFRAISADKKRMDQTFKFILLKDIGKASIYETSVDKLRIAYERSI